MIWIVTVWESFMVKPNEPISTGQLHALLRFHLPPIKVVVFDRSSYTAAAHLGRPYLEASFMLRCIQQLSFPDFATELCPWRDNSYTRGPSIPVLSY